MKNLKRILIVLLAVVAVATTASAQFRWGIKAGLNVSSLDISNVDNAVSNVMNTDNHTGFNVGLTTKFTVPVIGIGLDASAMYVHRTTNGSSDYIDIPINLRYELNLPVVSKIIAPYAYTGPSFAFLCSKSAFTEAMKRKSLDCAWNVGAGILLLQHLQISAGYGWGMTKAFEIVGGVDGTDVGRNNGWTVSAAYYF